MRYRVNVTDKSDDVIARVKYNADLDHWDGRNWSNGGLGNHKGITRLRDGRYVLIHGSDWQGSKDWAEIVSDETALQEILKSNNIYLLEMKKYKHLARLNEKLESGNLKAEEEE